MWSGVTGSSRPLASALLEIPQQGSAGSPSANHSLSVPQLQDLQRDTTPGLSLPSALGLQDRAVPGAVPGDQPCPAVPGAALITPWLTKRAEVTASRRAFISVFNALTASIR